MEFNESNIRKLFGPEAAEDEDISRLKEYYFKGSVFQKIHNDLPIRLLVGHKGIGKSATFKISHYNNIEDGNVSIWIKPDDIMEICNDDTTILQRIRDWKSGLSNLIFHKVLESIGLDNGNLQPLKPINLTTKLLSKVYETFSDLIKSKVSIEPIKKATIQKFLETNKIYVYIDDLDRGWEGNESGIKRISALLNASRDLTNDNHGLCIRISLRSDVYFLVRTSDESTDKIEGSVVWYSWTQHQILVLLAKRIQSFFGVNINEQTLSEKQQSEIAELFEDVFEFMFSGKGKWSYVPTYKVLASMIRRRPRDLVKLCTLAAKTAFENNHEYITTHDLNDNFDYYSQERIQDTINEYKSELPDIKRLLMGMKPSNKQRKSINSSGPFLYTSEELLNKLKTIEDGQSFIFSNGNTATTHELAAFLYKINFLVGRKEVKGYQYIDRRYFEDNKYLSNEFVDFGYQWEVHPAFRWALYPDAGNNIFDTLYNEKD